MPPHLPLDNDDLNDLFDRIGAERQRVDMQRAAWRADPVQAVATADVLGRRHAMAPWLPADALVAATFAGADDEMFGALAEASGFETAAHGGTITRAQSAQELAALANPFSPQAAARRGQILGPARIAEIEAEAAALSATTDPKGGDKGLWRFVATPAKAVSRTVTGALQTPYEFVTNRAAGTYQGVTRAAGGLLEGDLGEVAKGVGQAAISTSAPGLVPAYWQATTAGQTVSQLVDEGRVDTGEGFFVGGTVQQAQAQRARDVRGEIDGHAWTIGRAGASLVFEPGSQPYNYLSGAVDFAGALGLDPVNYVVPGAGARRARRAAQVVAPGDAARLGQAERGLAEAAQLEEVAQEAARGGQFVPDLFDTAQAARAEAATTVEAVERSTAITRARAKAPEGWREAVDRTVGLIDVPGMRRTVSTPKVMKWMLSTDGRRVVERLAREDMASPSKVMGAFNWRIDVRGANALAEADTPDKVLGVLATVFNGGQLRELPTVGHWTGDVGRLGMRVRNVAKNRYRLFGDVPLSTYLDPDDPEQAVRNLFDSLGNVGITGDRRRGLVDGWMRAKATGQPGDMKTAMTRVGNAVRDDLVHHGMDSEVATAVTDWQRAYGRASEHLVDDLGNSVNFDFVNGSNAPTRIVELMSSGQHLFDQRMIRDLRSATSHLSKIPGFKVAAKSDAWIANLQGRVWKPLVLIRPAYLTRVVGEEIVRTLFGGRFRHASDWLFAAAGHGYGTDLLGDTFDYGRRLTKLQEDIDDALDAGRNVDDLLAEQARVQARIDEGFGDSYRDAMAGKVRERAVGIALRDDRMAEYMIRTGSWSKVNRGDTKQWVRGQLEETAKLHRDPVARRVANGGVFDGDGDNLRAGMDGIVDWLTAGKGQKIADRMASAYPDVARDEVIQAWVEMSVKDVSWRTGRNADLLDTVATGRLRGAAAFKRTEGGTAATDDLRRFMDEFVAADEAPEWVKIELQLSRRQQGARNRLVEWFFGDLYGRSSDYLARSPTFRKQYWERVAETAGSLSPDEARKALAKLDKTRLPASVRNRVRTSLASARGQATLDDVDMVAKGFALDETKKLLYDASKRNQLLDVYRVIFPFGEAWKEIMTTWARIGVENPRILNAARKTIVAGRSADPDNDGQGFLYKNAFGKEVFAYPLSGRAAEYFTGINVDLEGELLGMSIGTNVLPGIGPVAAFGVEQLLPDSPTWDTVSELLFPFGSPDERDVSPLELALPSWAQKLGAAIPGVRGPFGLDNPERNVVYGNTLMETYSALAQSGKYDIHNTDPNVRNRELDRLDDDARHRAKILSVMRGLTQAAGPASPSLAFKVATADGDVLVPKLAEEFRAMQEEDYDTAVQRFLDRYGEGVFIYLASKTTTVNPGITPTDEFGRWERDHGGLIDRYPLVGAFFGPAGSEFSQSVYGAQIRRGQRERLDRNERVAIANDVMAKSIYYARKDELDAMTGGSYSPEQQAWLTSVRQDLERDYPGFSLAPDGKLQDQIVQLDRAADDREVQQLPAGQALVIYFDRRDELLAAQGQQGFTTGRISSAKGAAHLRSWMRQVGEDLSADYPDFARVWDQILSREIPEDAVEVAA